jgi:hypothetical protein
MFNHHQNTVGSYTTPVAWLAGAVFIPAVLLASWPLGYVTVALAIASATICVGLAWMDWKRVAR